MRWKKRWKRVISLALILAMCLQTISVHAMESDESVADPNTVTEQVEEQSVESDTASPDVPAQEEKNVGESESAECVQSQASDFTYSELNGSYITIIGYTGTDTKVQIPEVIGEYTVQEISSKAFQNDTALEEIVIPESVTTIGNYAFSGCTALKTVNLAEGLMTIYAYAFEQCTALTEIVLPDSVETMGYRVFKNCTNLTSVNYPMGWISSPGGNGSYSFEHGGIFYGCGSLKTISIPEGITSIVPYAFQECEYLVNVDIPDSVTVIGEYAFAGLFVAIRKIRGYGVPLLIVCF